MYDLLIKNGMVIDPLQSIHGIHDVALRGGRVVAVEKSLPEGKTANVIDASGFVVTPGLVDIHVHVYWGVSHYGLRDPDEHCVAKGVTSAADAGSAGAATFDGLRKYVLDKVSTSIKAFLNISAMGMILDEPGELQDLRWANVDLAVQRGREHRDILVGIKVRLSEGLLGENSDLEVLGRAIDAATQLHVPVMVHIGKSPSPLEKILAMLRDGDIVTHSFTGLKHGILDDQSKVFPEVTEAVNRGVILDVGHGKGSFSFDVMYKALSQGVLPGTISSDIHVYNVNGPVFDLATTLSKFLHLGLPLDEVIRLGTIAPAEAIGIHNRVGSLKLGMDGDVSIFTLEEGEFTFEDSYGTKAVGHQRLTPVYTIREGRKYVRT